MVEINRAVAVGHAFGPHEGLAVLESALTDVSVAGYQPLYAAHAELLRLAGEGTRAAQAYRRAIALSGNAVERTELERRLRALPEA